MGIELGCCNPIQHDTINTKELPKRTFTLTNDNFYEHNHMIKKKGKPFYGISSDSFAGQKENDEIEKVLLSVIDN